MIGTVIGGLIIAALTMMFRWVQQGARTSDPGAYAEELRITIALRLVGDEDEEHARSLASKYGETTNMSTEGMVDDMLRLASSATHFYAGPYVSELRSDLVGGLLIKFDARHPESRVSDRPGDIAGVQQWFREIPVVPATLTCVLSAATGQPLLARVLARVEEARPDHRLFGYCGQLFVLKQFTCPNCGLKVKGP